MKIIVENSTWNNVGDGWYQTALYFLLKNNFPQHDIMMGDGPIRRSFRLYKKKQMSNSLNLMEYERADLHVLSGPILPSVIRDYATMITDIKRKGEKYCMISVSGTNLNRDKQDEIGTFLKENPPMFVSTRDEETYNWLKEYVPNIYNGICTAFLVGKVIPLAEIKLPKPFFISSFYTELEPLYSLKEDSKTCSIENIEVKHRRTILHLPYRITRHFNYLLSQQKEIGETLIVRTIQNLNTKFNHINFATPNSFISFNPVNYLSLVKASEFTISDRVHACAVSLSLGHPVRFLFNTPRAGIFDRMGFDYKSNNGIMYPNQEKIDEEMNKLVNFIGNYIS